MFSSRAVLFQKIIQAVQVEGRGWKAEKDALGTGEWLSSGGSGRLFPFSPVSVSSISYGSQDSAPSSWLQLPRASDYELEREGESRKCREKNTKLLARCYLRKTEKNVFF